MDWDLQLSRVNRAHTVRCFTTLLVEGSIPKDRPAPSESNQSIIRISYLNVSNTPSLSHTE
jgi:hypothetical protein